MNQRNTDMTHCKNKTSNDMLNKIKNSVLKFAKRRTKGIPITKIQNEKWYISTNAKKIQKIISSFFKSK